jgi:hypothetical protein
LGPEAAVIQEVFEPELICIELQPMKSLDDAGRSILVCTVDRQQTQTTIQVGNTRETSVVVRGANGNERFVCSEFFFEDIPIRISE